VTLWNTVTYWLVLTSALPGLTLRQAAISSTTSTAVANTVPGGAAFGVVTTSAMYASWGVPAPAIARAVVVTGVWNTFVKLGMPVVALALLAVAGEAGAGLVGAALAGVAVLAVAVAVFALMLRSEALARQVGSRLAALAGRGLRLLRRREVGDWGEAAVRFRRDTIGLLHEKWVPLTLATLVSHISLYVVLLVALRAHRGPRGRRGRAGRGGRRRAGVPGPDLPPARALRRPHLPAVASGGPSRSSWNSSSSSSLRRARGYRPTVVSRSSSRSLASAFRGRSNSVVTHPPRNTA
jgi:hypothetical protein